MCTSFKKFKDWIQNNRNESYILTINFIKLNFYLFLYFVLCFYYKVYVIIIEKI